MVPCRCLADPQPLSHEPPPGNALRTLFLACPVVQNRGSSFQGDMGRLKVKPIGTNLALEMSQVLVMQVLALPEEKSA